ncbi:hypothetical protein NDU88_010062 [Pleurodeles waltl]|uniref:Uncharacterized protein n=1 Tax=Pleurodeles waltl TaxID=8319 RepID=A0AAV7S267_PLEWA|nr:hypothetical protein NDU88_010062 [Pleurodeles waltl]
MEVRAEVCKSAQCPATASSGAGAWPGQASPLTVLIPIHKPQALIKRPQLNPNRPHQEQKAVRGGPAKPLRVLVSESLHLLFGATG